jgi:hypothetical protein
MLTNIKSLDKYLEQIGATKENIIALWEQGSFLEGINDEFSDRDFAVVWSKDVTSADKRLKAAEDLGFDIHEIKDVPAISQSFDLWSNGEFLFNIGHGTKEKEVKWYEKLNSEKYSSDIEDVLMSISAVESAKIYFQKDNWVDNLIAKFDLSKYKAGLINYYKQKSSTDLAILEKSTKRRDFLEFIKYLHKVLRSLQIIYLLEHNLPIISTKHFEERFGRVENGEITKLIRKASSQVNMNEIYEDTLQTAYELEVKKSEKFRA